MLSSLKENRFVCVFIRVVKQIELAYGRFARITIGMVCCPGTYINCEILCMAKHLY